MRDLVKSVYRKKLLVRPQPWTETASEVAFKITKRPFHFFDSALHPPARLKRGAVTFSADFELAWGFRYSRASGENCIAKGLRERASSKDPRRAEWIQHADNMGHSEAPIPWNDVKSSERCKSEANFIKAGLDWFAGWMDL